MDEHQGHILIFVSRRSQRLDYIFHHLFGRILRVPYRFTSRIEEFVAYNGPKFSYTTKAFGQEFHVFDSGFLYEKGVRPREIAKGYWRNLPVIFHTAEPASIPFDLFAAAFYLISRYEEYLPYEPDEHGRFPYARSIAQSMGFLDRPIVEQWLLNFVQALQEKFPAFRVPQPEFRFEPLVNVAVSHLYKHKGPLRFVGGVVDNLFRLHLRNAWARIKYAHFKRKDPYDTFYKFIALKKQTRIPMRFFFLLGVYSRFDHNISPSRPALKRIVKTVADYADTGLLVSYEAAGYPQRIKQEKNILEDLVHKPVETAHYHYYRNRLPQAYQQLLELEFTDDYTMGYARITGYRASTAHPFPFYDLQEERPRELTVHPVVINDYQLNFIYKYSPGEALSALIETGNEIRRLGGVFHPVFHNAVLSEYEEWKGWSKVFTELLKHFGQ